MRLIDRTAQTVAYLHHREHGWKNARAGIPRAKAGVMRRVSMAIPTMTQAQTPNPYTFEYSCMKCTKTGVFAHRYSHKTINRKSGKIVHFRPSHRRVLQKGRRNGVELRGASRENGANWSCTVAEAANK